MFFCVCDVELLCFIWVFCLLGFCFVFFPQCGFFYIMFVFCSSGVCVWYLWGGFCLVVYFFVFGLFGV